MMPKHRVGAGGFRWFWPAVAVLAASALAVAAALAVFRGAPSDAAYGIGGSACERAVKVVTATSFAPVLNAMAPVLDHGRDCVRLDITTSDGRAAVRRVAEVNADV